MQRVVRWPASFRRFASLSNDKSAVIVSYLTGLFKKLTAQGPQGSLTYQFRNSQGLMLDELEVRVMLSGTDVFWDALDTIPASKGSESYLRASEFAPFTLDSQHMGFVLENAPIEYSNASPVIITLPTPEGGFERFSIVESPIMAPELAAQFPEIRTYSGQGIDNAAAKVRLDMSPVGLHAQVLSPTGAYYIDPFYHLDDSVYASYFAATSANELPEFNEVGVEI